MYKCWIPFPRTIKYRVWPWSGEDASFSKYHNPHRQQEKLENVTHQSVLINVCKSFERASVSYLSSVLFIF